MSITATASPETILIIGPGRVGTTLALAAQNAKIPVLGAIALRHHATGFHTYTGLPVRIWEDTEEVNDWLMRASLVIVSVPDREITYIATKLAAEGALLTDTCVVHTAGSLGIAALHPLNRTSALLGAMHPLQSFAEPTTALVQLCTTYAGIEATGVAAERIEQFAKKLGLRPFALVGTDRARYHAAAVLASNAITALAYAAKQLLPSGVPLDALLPLMRGAVENLGAVGLPNALTGPIDRGDVATVQRHIEDIDETTPEVAPVYRVLSQVMLTLATQKNVLTTDQIGALEHVLQTKHVP